MQFGSQNNLFKLRQIPKICFAFSRLHNFNIPSSILAWLKATLWRTEDCGIHFSVFLCPCWPRGGWNRRVGTDSPWLSPMSVNQQLLGLMHLLRVCRRKWLFWAHSNAKLHSALFTHKSLQTTQRHRESWETWACCSFSSFHCQDYNFLHTGEKRLKSLRAYTRVGRALMCPFLHLPFLSLPVFSLLTLIYFVLLLS